MLNEGFKINLLRRDREKAHKQARAERKAEWKARRDHTFKSGLVSGFTMYATDRSKPFEDRLKYDMESRTLNKLDRERAKSGRRKMEREEGVQEGFGSEKVKPWLAKKSPKFKAALTKHGPKLQKHADKWGGRASMVGHHIDRFSKSNPKTATALKWGGGIATAVAASTITNVASHYLSHKAKMKDPNYEYETRRRHGRVREHYSDVCEALHNMVHTQNAVKGIDHKRAGQVAVMRSMAQDKVAASGRGIMNDKRFKVPSRSQTNTKKESVSDLVQLRVDPIYEFAQILAPLAGAGAKAVGSAVAKKAAQVTVKSVAKSAAKSAGSWAGSKAVNKIASRKESVDEGWGSIAASTLKGATAKGLYKAAGQAAAGQVGAGIGNRVGTRIATGSNRKQMKRAKFQRKLHRKAGGYYREDIETALIEKLSGKTGLKVASKVMGIAAGGGIAGTSGGVNVGSITRMSKRMKSAVGMGEDVSPKARSQFEIDPIKQRSQYLHMMRNEYIAQKGKISSKAKRQNTAKPNEASRHVQEGMAGAAAKKGYAWLTKGTDQEQFKRLGKVAVGGAVAAGVARHAYKRRGSNLRYQRKMAKRHERGYNKAYAHLDYADAIKAAKEQRSMDLRKK